MENTEEATRTCDKCHKEVAEANFALHETHCRRFLCLCPDCEEYVPREQLNEHRETQHTLVRCSKCNQKMERCQLTDHESDECVERLQCCQFCELELPVKELDEHCLACGSRTELCRECGRYVTLRDQPEHDLTCSAADDGSGPPQTTSKLPPNNTTTTATCSRCMVSLPAEDIEEHENDWYKRDRQLAQELVETNDRLKESEYRTHQLKCVPATRLDDEEAAPEEEESKEEGEDEGDFSEQGATPRLSSTYKAMSLSNGPSRGPWVNGVDPDQISTCPHCHLALPVFTLRWHQVKCQILIHLK